MMLDRMEGNAELKSSVQLMLAARRLTHSVLLVGEEGLGAGFAARCIAADYLYPAGGAPAEALLRGECCRAVGKPGDRDSGHVETGIVREAISVAGMGAGGEGHRGDAGHQPLSGGAAILVGADTVAEADASAVLGLGGHLLRRTGAGLSVEADGSAHGAVDRVLVPGHSTVVIVVGDDTLIEEAGDATHAAPVVSGVAACHGRHVIACLLYTSPSPRDA